MAEIPNSGREQSPGKLEREAKCVWGDVRLGGASEARVRAFPFGLSYHVFKQGVISWQ